MPSSSASTESSSDSGNTEKTPTFSLLLFKQKKKPSPSCSMKRPREEPRGEEASKPSSKKSKKPAQEDSKEKAAQDPEAEKSAKKTSGPIWNDKDEAAFANRLAAQCENGKHLPHNMTGVFEGAKEYLDGDYNHHQMYNKLRGLRKKFAATEDKLKEKSFDGFKSEHAESLYKMCKQVNWGKRKEKEKEKEKKHEHEQEMEQEQEQGQQKEKKQEQQQKEQEEEEEEEEEGEGHDAARENLSPPLQDGTPHAMTRQRRMFDQHCKEGLSSARELPPLSKTEAEMLDLKWQRQHFIEMEAISKRVALCQEECQLRLAKFHHQNN